MTHLFYTELGTGRLKTFPFSFAGLHAASHPELKPAPGPIREKWLI
jgi:hypothetical protein